jgi:hypothetical protein
MLPEMVTIGFSPITLLVGPVETLLLKDTEFKWTKNILLPQGLTLLSSF